MRAPEHLTDEQLARYRDGTSVAAELLEFDDHLSRCAPCRQRLAGDNRVFSGIRSLRGDFSEHLDYAQTVACSEGSGTAEQRAHLRDCTMCRAEVQDLSRFRTELQDAPRTAVVTPIRKARKWIAPAGVAAAIVLVAGGSYWSSRRHTEPVTVASTPKPAREAPLPAADQALLDRAIASNMVERAAVLNNLLVKPGVLLGAPASETSLRLLSPIGTTVTTDRPLFRWTPVPNAGSYVVSVFDEHFERVAESPALTGTDWKPAKPLPRQGVLLWQVTADVRGQRVRAPQPPAPEARFEVISEDEARHIAEVQQQHPGNSLLMAALYAHAGALDDAEAALHAMDPAAAERYLESIARIRKGE